VTDDDVTDDDVPGDDVDAAGIPDSADLASVPAPMAVGARTSGGDGGLPRPGGAGFDEAGFDAGAIEHGGSAAAAPDGGAIDDEEDELTEEHEEEEQQRRLRRSVFVEVLLMVVVLAVTAALVNAAPGRAASTQPVFMTLKSHTLWFDVTIAPGSAGRNDIHLTALPTGSGLTQVKQLEVQLTQSGRDLPPFAVPMEQLGTNHYYSQLFDIPYPGTWQITVRAQVSATDEVVATGRFSLR
jgi:hypothetical protein